MLFEPFSVGGKSAPLSNFYPFGTLLTEVYSNLPGMLIIKVRKLNFYHMKYWAYWSIDSFIKL